eukprot:Skav204627  [mRNA]  locus=scaffold1712:288646:289528:- [translate_table: standard]
MDPFHTVTAVLAVTPLAPTWRPGPSAFAELLLSCDELLELRMTTRDQLAETVPQHRWPYEMKISLDGKELISLDPPTPNSSKRKDEPLELPPASPMQARADAVFTVGKPRQLQLLAWDAPRGVKLDSLMR